MSKCYDNIKAIQGSDAIVQIVFLWFVTHLWDFTRYVSVVEFKWFVMFFKANVRIVKISITFSLINKTLKE